MKLIYSQTPSRSGLRIPVWKLEDGEESLCIQWGMHTNKYAYVMHVKREGDYLLSKLYSPDYQRSWALSVSKCWNADDGRKYIVEVL